MLAKNPLMQNRASQVLKCLSDAPVVTVEPGFTVESRITHGVHGEGDDLALSVEWRDAEDCLWAADFSENALAQAEIDGGAVSLLDLGGAKVMFRLYQPTKRIIQSR
jgi:hypothetical protein